MSQHEGDQIMNNDDLIRFPGFAARTIVAHTVTYFCMGVLAAAILDYHEQFSRPFMACWMRPTTDPLVMAGPLFQPIRGFIFALVFYRFRDILFSKPRGWLLTWWTLVGLGIISTFGPAPGSIEGMVYTVIPLRDQLTGWLEIVPQALLLSGILYYWVRHPQNRRLDWTLGIAFAIVLLLPLLGLVFIKSASL
jgi:hypothetical protein